MWTRSRQVVLNEYEKGPGDNKNSKIHYRNGHNRSKLESKDDLKLPYKNNVEEGKMESKIHVSKIICDPIIPIEQNVYDFNVKDKNKKSIE